MSLERIASEECGKKILVRVISSKHEKGEIEGCEIRHLSIQILSGRKEEGEKWEEGEEEVEIKWSQEKLVLLSEFDA